MEPKRNLPPTVDGSVHPLLDPSDFPLSYSKNHDLDFIRSIRDYSNQTSIAAHLSTPTTFELEFIDGFRSAACSGLGNMRWKSLAPRFGRHSRTNDLVRLSTS